MNHLLRKKNYQKKSTEQGTKQKPKALQIKKKRIKNYTQDQKTISKVRCKNHK